MLIVSIPARVGLQLVRMRSIEDSEINSQQDIPSYGNYLFKSNQSERFLGISTGFDLMQCNVKKRNNHLGVFLLHLNVSWIKRMGKIQFVLATRWQDNPHHPGETFRKWRPLLMSLGLVFDFKLLLRKSFHYFNNQLQLISEFNILSSHQQQVTFAVDHILVHGILSWQEETRWEE